MFRLHVYLHDEPGGAIQTQLDQILARQRLHGEMLAHLLGVLSTMDAKTRASLDALNAAVAQESAVEDSVIVLLQGMASAINDLKTGDPAVDAAIDAATAIIGTNAARAAQAVVTGTAVLNPPVVTPPVDVPPVTPPPVNAPVDPPVDVPPVDPDLT